MKKAENDVVWINETYKGKKYLSNHMGLKGVIEALQEALDDEASGKWKDLTLRIVGNEYDDGSSLAIKGLRPETEKERTERLNRDKNQKEYRQKMYEQLKKEFGD